MLQTSDDIVTDVAESLNNLCAKLLLNNLVEAQHVRNVSSTTSLDQQSNSSSLESISSPILDSNQALSTSCSEDSFELSSATSKLTTEDASQLSCQDLNITSNVKNSEETVQLLEPVLDYSKQYASEYNNSDQLSVDSFAVIRNSPLQNMNVEINLANCQHNTFDSLRIKENETSLNAKLNLYDAKLIESWPKRHGTPSTSKSANCYMNTTSEKRDKASLREYIDKELDNLDTCLPQLDFNKLEEKLNCAAEERLVTERKLLGEQVRRRLALQVDQYTAGPVPRVYTRPSKSNLGFRLQTAMNLQVCYISDLKDEDEREEEESSDDDCFVPKSKSAPNLRSSVIDGSNLNASQLRQAISVINKEEKRQVLEEETKLMLAKAKQAAKMQMEIEKLNTDRFITTIPPKTSRLQLSKMTRRQLIEMSEQLIKCIDEENAELMRLLVEKDSLHMQQDSMLVDIEDLMQ
ncbi:unnamed protein product [Thelazia callipaeda]|uniref:SCHIP-1 domain-containing protein n=1 Tax=Thelazia callipaeda TaxID=103827 RepID=A0A158RB47_THECL|nr:unnamed protein product [Thelazia callipaeda]